MTQYLEDDKADQLHTLLKTLTPEIIRDKDVPATRTFTGNGHKITLAQTAFGIQIDNGDVTIGTIMQNSPNYELFRELIVESSNDQSALDQLLGGEPSKAALSLAKIDFMQLFTLAELTDIQDLQLGDPDASPAIAVDKNVRTVMRVFDETEQVDLTKPVVQGFVAYLKTKDSPNRASVKVLTAARATKILKGEPPASVI